MKGCDCLARVRRCVVCEFKQQVEVKTIWKQWQKMWMSKKIIACVAREKTASILEKQQKRGLAIIDLLK